LARSHTQHNCLVLNCSGEGRNQIGIRCRIAHSGDTPFPNKRRTDAIFSVESDAFLCDEHALNGVSLALAVAPNRSHEASLSVVCGRAMSGVRSTAITQPGDESVVEAA
jgi:hypothetical protein